MTTAQLNWLHLDLNSYFASVEQELRPELRGRAIAVVPVMAETTCCIAASYEARRFGIRAGVTVRDARRLCPEIELVESRPKLYVQMHHQIVAAIEQCLPVHATLSCDEFACHLAGTQCAAARATELAREVKQHIRQRVGATLRCSIGIGPNRLLAKIAAGMRKPDGLMVVERSQLPHILHELELRDIPGVGERMERRLVHSGIHTVEELCTSSRQRLANAWGGVLGDRMWLELRGEDLGDPPERPAQTISRQHILPPELRTREGGRQTALKMLNDCTRRMRKRNLWAGGLGLAVFHLNHDYAFEAHCRIPPCADILSLQEHFLPLWAGSPNHVPSSLCIFLTDLIDRPAPELFPPEQNRARAAACQAMDQIHRRFGSNALYPASLQGAHTSAPTRISFGPPPPAEEF